MLNIECIECLRSEHEREIRRINSEIERQIKKDKREARKEYKILFLGAGESGKSTFIRHMKLLHGDGYNEVERRSFIPIIHQNILNVLVIIVPELKLDDKENKEDKELVEMSLKLKNVTISTAVTLRDNGMEEVEAICADKRVKQFLDSDMKYKLPDSAGYFMGSVERLLQEDYLPSTEDILRMRQASTGISEIYLPFGQVRFRLVDVGGQRSERRKWIHCFETVASIIFLTSLAEFNQTLFEAPDVNRMEESLALFEAIITNDWLKSSSVILFLNKKDIFEEKIKHFDIIDYFPDYGGAAKDVIQAREYILERFESVGSRYRPTIYSHITCATDPDNVRFVFAAVKDHILNQIVNELFNNTPIH